MCGGNLQGPDCSQKLGPSPQHPILCFWPMRGIFFPSVTKRGEAFPWTSEWMAGPLPLLSLIAGKGQGSGPGKGWDESPTFSPFYSFRTTRQSTSPKLSLICRRGISLVVRV